MERIDGHIFLSDLYDMCDCHKDLQVEVNYDSEYVGEINNIDFKGSYMCVLGDEGKDGMDAKQIAEVLSKHDFSFNPQLFIVKDDKVYVVTSIDHIDFLDSEEIEIEEIEVYAEQIN